MHGVSLLGKEKIVEIINEKDKNKRNIILTYSLMLLFAPFGWQRKILKLINTKAKAQENKIKNDFFYIYHH